MPLRDRHHHDDRRVQGGPTTRRERAVADANDHRARGRVALVGISLTAAIIAQAEIGGTTRRRRMEKRIDNSRSFHRARVRARRTGGRPEPRRRGSRSRWLIRRRTCANGWTRTPALPRGRPSLEPVLRRAGVERARGCSARWTPTRRTSSSRHGAPDEPGPVHRGAGVHPGLHGAARARGADRVAPFVSSGRHMVRMAQDPSIVDSSIRAPAPSARSPSKNGSSTRATPPGADRGRRAGGRLALRRSDGS